MGRLDLPAQAEWFPPRRSCAVSRRIACSAGLRTRRPFSVWHPSDPQRMQNDVIANAQAVRMQYCIVGIPNAGIDGFTPRFANSLPATASTRHVFFGETDLLCPEIVLQIHWFLPRPAELSLRAISAARLSPKSAICWPVNLNGLRQRNLHIPRSFRSQKGQTVSRNECQRGVS